MGMAYTFFPMEWKLRDIGKMVKKWKTMKIKTHLKRLRIIFLKIVYKCHTLKCQASINSKITAWINKTVLFWQTIKLTIIFMIISIIIHRKKLLIYLET